MLSLGPEGSLVPHIAVNLSPSPDGASFETLRQFSASLLALSLADPAQAPQFFFRSLNFQLPSMVMTHARASGFHANRSAEDIARDPAPVFQIHVQLSGSCEVQAGGRTCRTEPGDVTFFDYAQPFQSVATDFEMVMLLLARDRAPPGLLTAAAHGMRLPRENGSARLIASAAIALHDALPVLTVAEGEFGADAFCRLAAGLLEIHLSGGEPERDKQTELTLDAALRFIEERLADRALDASVIVRRFDISRSTLYHLFQPLGGVDTAIRLRRLDHAMRAILADDFRRLHTVRQAFSNEEHFARAFKTRFGERPAQFRARVQNRDEAWLRAQARRAGFSSYEAWLEALKPSA